MLLWHCVFIDNDGLAFFRQGQEYFATYGNGYVVGAWYKYIKESNTMEDAK